MKTLPKPWSGEMKALPKPWPFDEPADRRQIVSDATSKSYLPIITRLLNQQRRIEELKRLCGIK